MAFYTPIDKTSYIVSKAVSIQPNIYIPKDYELWELSYSEVMFEERDVLNYYLKRLNLARKNLGNDSDAYSHFLIESYNSIKGNFIGKKLVSECVNCGDLFHFVLSKKYCSDRCRKAAENKRLYKKHGQKLRELKKQDMQETRQFYKQLGVKK